MKCKNRFVTVATVVITLLPIWPASTQTPVGTKIGNFRSVEPAPIFGDLKTDWNKPIKLNDVPVVSGTAITSGILLETVEGVGAAVTLKGKARLRIQPATKLMLNFSNEGVVIELVNGCVTLNTEQNFAGTIKTPIGKTVMTDPGSRDHLEVCSREEGRVVTACGVCPSSEPPITPAAGGISPLLFILGGGAGTAAVVVATTSSSGRNSPLSTFTP